MPKRKKYQTKHEWVRKNIPRDFQEIVDSAVDHIGSIINNTGPRDIVYIAAYVAAVTISYNFLTGLKLLPYQVYNDILRTLTFGLIGVDIEQIEEGLKREPIDPLQLAKAMVAGYMLLKIDVADVASAVSKLGSAAVTSLVGAPVVAP